MLLAFNGLGAVWYVLFGSALLFPLIMKFIFKWEITILEYLIGLPVVMLVIWGTLAIGRGAAMTDTEIWNGQVTGKEKEWVMCNHCDDEGCDHFHDWKWTVHTTFGDIVLKRTGNLIYTKPRGWDAITVGEPASKRASYINYIVGIGDSYFESGPLVEEFHDQLPKYPGKIYDHYKIDRVVTVDVNLPDAASWNDELSLILRRIGPEKEANVVIVMVNNDDPRYVYALQQHWLGAKKNDVVVVLGVTDYPKIAWARVFSLNANPDFEPKLADTLETVGTLDRDAVIDTIDEIVYNDFERLSMKNFEELKYQIEPPFLARLLGALLCWIATIGLSVFFHRNEIA